MRKLLVLALPLVAVVGLAIAATPEIQPDAVLGHIKYLASDELKGRGNGQEGLERAAEYIAEQFKAAGLRPAGASNNWFQPFELQAGLTAGVGNELLIETRGRAVRLSLGSGYYPLAATPNDSSASPSADFDNLPLVFAGYGISAPSVNYDDYAGLDVTGKAVLIFSHEPQEARTESRLNGLRPLGETTLEAKAAAARSRGARVLIVVSDPSHRVDQANYELFSVDPDAEEHGIPVLRVRRSAVTPLLQGWALDAVAASIDRDLIPRSRALAGAEVDYTEFLARNRHTVRNVVGILPGSDPTRADEAVVIGAHYDHVGLGGRFSSDPERTGEIHNGADDNASGTSAIIEMAKAAAADRSRFPRSLVFAAFAGEERGLLGSAHYANSPSVPLSNTVAMLDLDMVGRSRGKLQTSGLEKAPSLETDLLAAVKAAGGIDLGRQGPGAGRSDDANFLQQRIPSIIFFTGFHSDYHRPGDDWDKIDAPGTARVATIALEFAARIAARLDRPAFVD
ncbi:MAG TPA: M28 family peptidase [Vicinamibacterales bacterium]